MLKSGWIFDQRSERHIKSQTDGTMLDLCFLSLSHEAWQAWKRRNEALNRAISGTGR
jgi:hypothetical protein